MGKGICYWQQWYLIGNNGTRDPLMLHHEQTIFGEEIHTLITLMVSVMASNIVVAYNPLINYIRNHACMPLHGSVIW